jgi:valyl-tRNA synthetase
LLFDESLCEQGRNFNNKIWNSYRLIAGWKTAGTAPDEVSGLAVTWFRAKLNNALAEINELYNQFRVSDALMASYKLLWDDFCSVYLELVKPKDGTISASVLESTLQYFEALLKILHPFVPFITEELWHQIRIRNNNEYLIVAPWPQVSPVDSRPLEDMEMALELVTALRNFRNQKGIPFRDALEVSASEIPAYAAVVRKLANVSGMEKVSQKPNGAFTLIVKSGEFYVPSGGFIDKEAEQKKIRKELDYTRGFMESILKKLSNERFVQNAKPEVVEVERRKLADAEARLKSLQEQLAALG